MCFNSTGVNASGLANAGYQQYVAPPAPGLNMGAYGPQTATQATAAQVNPNANATLTAQNALAAQLGQQATGGGPNIQAQQLRQGTEANLATQLAAAASQRGNQNPGAAKMALANQAASTNQAAAGQAAQERGEQQMASQAAEGGVLGQIAGQQIGLGENNAALAQQTALQNAAASNQAGEFSEESAQAGNQAVQNQYQYGTNLAAAQQSQENQIIGNSAAQASQSNQSGINGLVNAGVSGLANAAGSVVGAIGAEKGELVTKPVERVLGEHGKAEVVVPLEGKEDPHEFLDRMIRRYSSGKGTTPGGYVDSATLKEALAGAAQDHVHIHIHKAGAERPRGMVHGTLIDTH